MSSFLKPEHKENLKKARGYLNDILFPPGATVGDIMDKALFPGSEEYPKVLEVIEKIEKLLGWE